MSDSRALDESSRRRIREAARENILVEAGAGSGKTQMLAERMAAGIAAGVYEVEHMAAVTFTRKAASELRGRLHLALESELARTSASPAKKPADARRLDRLRFALSNLERFFAGTIHSFCARLLKERPVECGVSPGFAELDESQDLDLRQRVWREFITNARAAGDASMSELLRADMRPRDLDPAFSIHCENEDVEFSPGEGACPDPEPAWRALETFWGQLQDYLPKPIDPDTTCRIQQAADAFQRRLRVSFRRVDQPSVMAALLAIWDRDPKIVQKWWADSTQKKRVAGVVVTLHENFRAAVVEPYLIQWRQYVYRLAIILLTQARKAAAAERRRLNALNYGDLLNLTARVLRENVSVRRALQQKFRYLLVDEFQDTDPIQAEILFWLAEDGSAQAPAAGGVRPDWRNVSLRPGALFVVGDPKQSIYRFRRADIDIYNTVRRRFAEPGGGAVLPLTLNFRSAPELCQWANEVFQTRFPAEPTEHAPRFTPLDPDPKKATTGNVFTLTHTCEKGRVQAEDARKIASFIRVEVDAGRRKFSDFLILTRRKRDRISPYAEALEALNIPVEVSGAGAFGDSREVQALTGLLRALADPLDAVALIAVLRGPLFGVSDPELYAFRKHGGRFNLFGKPDDLERPADPVRLALDAMAQYYRWTRVLPASGALERILEHSGYLAMASTTPGGVDAGDLIHAIDRVRQVAEGGGSLADAADALEADRDATSEVESLPLEPGRTEVVRLMNLHKAKGLEADVVFLADPLGGTRPRVDVHIERTELDARGWLKIARRSETSRGETRLAEPANWQMHEATELPYLDAEVDRLLYVAATRARQLLVVSRWPGNAGQTPPAWGVLNDFLRSARELAVPDPTPGPVVELPDCSTTAQEAAEHVRAQVHSRLVQPSWQVASVTALARQMARIRGSVDAAADDPTKVVVADTPSHRADLGQAWGTLVHGMLEHAMRHRKATREDLRRLARWLTIEEPQLRAVIDDALDTVEAVASDAFWIEAKRATECHEEVPFAVLEKSEGLPRVLNGVIDLVYSHSSGWRIIDYKTDVNVGAAASSEKYARQVSDYQRAWSRFVLELVTSDVVSTRVTDATR